MKLFYRKRLIALIKNVGPNEMGLTGSIELLAEAEPFIPLFDFMIDEERNHEELPFSEELLEGWSIEDDEGVERSIFVPAIANNHTTIDWRW